MPEQGTVSATVKPSAPKPRRLSKRSWIIIGAAVLIVAAAVVGFVMFNSGSTNNNASVVRNSNASKLVRRAIDGVYDNPVNERLFPVGVMIENLASIRPQAALVKANLVYEALVEGGITRFLAVYTLTGPIANIGPVRSARPYYLDWAKELGVLYAHAGGSAQALSDIQSKDIFNLDQAYDSQYYWRKDLDRATEHTLFTSSDKLVFALRDKQAAKTSDFTAWEFKDDVALAARPADVKPITIDFSSSSYQVVYQYDRTTNTYKRSQGGAPHVDMDTSEQISPKNVVVQYMKTGLADAQRLTMDTVGTGNAVLFQDGTAITGTWRKQSTDARTEFFDQNGEAMVFNGGQTWVEVVPDDREVTY